MAAKKQKRIIKRDKTTGEIKYVNYYEKVGKTKEGKDIYRKSTEAAFYKERGAKERKALTLDEAIDYLEYLSADFETIQTVKLDYRVSEKAGDTLGRTYTKEGLESKVKQRHMGRTENFLAQLGFSLTEFSDAFGVSEEYVLEKGFEKIGNVTYQLRGTDLVFVWDYERGLVEG